MKRLCMIAAVLISLLTSTNSYSGETLSLRDAIALALKNNNTYKISLEKVRESRLGVLESWGLLWPSLSSDISYTRMGADSGLTSGTDAQWTAHFVTGELYVNPGAFYNKLQASRKGHVIAEHEVRSAKADTNIGTIKSYYQLLLARESIKLHRESLKSLGKNLDMVTAGYKRGTFSKLEFLSAKVEYSNQEAKLIKAENDYLSAQATMNIHIGREIESPLELDPLTLRVDVEELVILKFSHEKEKKELSNMIGLALKNRPELLKLKLKKSAETYGAKAAESVHLWPTFFLIGDYGTSKTISEPSTNPIIASMSSSEWNNNWNITFGASYSWGSWSPIEAYNLQGKKLRSQAKQTDFLLRDLIRGVKLEVQTGFLKLKSASISIQSQQGNIETAEESFRVANIQFMNGIIDNTKLLQANVALMTAKTFYIQAMYDYQVSRAELNRAIGRDYFDIK